MSASKVISGVTLAWHSLTGFLEKHVGDLLSVGDALSGVAAALPIDPQDKERITNAVSVVETSAKNITDWLANAPANPGEVTIKESDIVEAIGNYFNSDAGKALLASVVHPSTEGNANAG